MRHGSSKWETTRIGLDWAMQGNGAHGVHLSSRRCCDSVTAGQIGIGTHRGSSGMTINSTASCSLKAPHTWLSCRTQSRHSFTRVTRASMHITAHGVRTSPSKPINDSFSTLESRRQMYHSFASICIIGARHFNRLPATAMTHEGHTRYCPVCAANGNVHNQISYRMYIA
jgi:hypothetical protein